MHEEPSRIAIVGHYTYFENHFPENWKRDPRILCIDVSEADYSWLLAVHNFRPELTLFFRPELYPRRYLELIPGVRVAILSEPLPSLRSGELEYTDETSLRLQVYSGMAWDAYHWRIFYDKGKKASAEVLGFPIDEYRPMPIDTETFRRSLNNGDRSIDVAFLGKPTPHRISRLDFLRSSRLKFVWVAHGLSGKGLAEFFGNCKLAINVHADGREAFEPRLYLAAACGAGVLTEPLSSRPELFAEQIWECDGVWNEALVLDIMNRTTQSTFQKSSEEALSSLSTRKLIADVWQHFKGGDF